MGSYIWSTALNTRPNRVIKTRTSWTRHVALVVGGMRNAHETLIGKHEGKRTWGELSI
jgi:hypothetical protein